MELYYNELMVFYFTLFVLGIVVGSFLNVVVYWLEGFGSQKSENTEKFVWVTLTFLISILSDIHDGLQHFS